VQSWKKGKVQTDSKRVAHIRKCHSKKEKKKNKKKNKKRKKKKTVSQLRNQGEEILEGN